MDTSSNAHQAPVNQPLSNIVIVLVHGAFHGSWCWQFQRSELEKQGFRSVLVDLPCTSGSIDADQFDDARKVCNTITHLMREKKNVVVLGHSYAGPICSAALRILPASQEGEGLLLGLINLCAYIFPGEMDQGKVIDEIGGLDYVHWNTPEVGLFILKDPKQNLMLPDVPNDRAEWALKRLRPQSMAANRGIVPPQVWQDEKYTGGLGYIRTTHDNIVSISEQDAMIEAAGGKKKWKVRTLQGSGHSPHLSRPKDVAMMVTELIEEFRCRTSP